MFWDLGVKKIVGYVVACSLFLLGVWTYMYLLALLLKALKGG